MSSLPLQGTLRLSAEERALILDMITQAREFLDSASMALTEEATADPNSFRVDPYTGPARLEYVRQRLDHALRCAGLRVKRARVLLTAYEHGISSREGNRW